MPSPAEVVIGRLEAATKPELIAAVRAVLALTPPAMSPGDDPDTHALRTDGWVVGHDAALRAIGDQLAAHRRRRSSALSGSVEAEASLGDLEVGMVYQEREGHKRWYRILEIHPVRGTIMGARNRIAVVERVFGPEFEPATSIVIYEYSESYRVKLVPKVSA